MKRIIFILKKSMLIIGIQEIPMEQSDDLDRETRKVETEIHKAELDRQVKDLGQEINKTGHELSEKIRKMQD